jgi:hypothetical protein
VEEITWEVGNTMIENQIRSQADLHAWLGKASYKTIELSDGSKWIVRESDSSGTPAHIHPARNQTAVIRMKSSHVKTAIALMYENRGNLWVVNDFNTLRFNTIRTEKTSLSPVKSLEESKRIMATYRFLTEVPACKDLTCDK